MPQTEPSQHNGYDHGGRVVAPVYDTARYEDVSVIVPKAVKLGAREDDRPFQAIIRLLNILIEPAKDKLSMVSAQMFLGDPLAGYSKLSGKLPPGGSGPYHREDFP